MSAMFPFVGKLAARLIAAAGTREPDFIVGGADRPYLRRWWVIPRNKMFNIYLHQFVRSDDDRALHDHPWLNASILLRGSYVEHTIAAGGINRRSLRTAGDIVFRRAKAAHRVEIDAPCWSLFITGPVIREWGFHCPDEGWIHWHKFTNPADAGATVGKGCAQ